MLSANKALVGKRVYKGVRQAPNQGQVSAQGAQGYIRRELANKNQLRNNRRLGIAQPRPVGRDGRSDSRSAVAAQALRRNQGRPLVGGTKGANGPYQNEGRPLVGGPRGSGGQGGRPQAQAPPQVQVNDAGLLELPYNQAFAQEQYNALADSNQQLLDLNTEAGEQGLAHAQGLRDTEQAYSQAKMGTLNQNAAQGTAFSSKYGTGVSNNATAYANAIGGLNSQNTQFQNNQANQRSAIQNALNQQLALAVQNYGVELGGQAGSLGYGQVGQPKGGYFGGDANWDERRKKYTRGWVKDRNRRRAAGNALKRKKGK